MKKTFLLILISYSFIYGTGGELFFSISNFPGSVQLKFEKITGETYWDQNFNIITPPDFIFTGSGTLPVKADAAYDNNGNGTIDDNGNQFVVYYGKFKVTITGGGISRSFTMDYLDCDYSGDVPKYTIPDVYFKFAYGTNEFIWTDVSYSDNYGDYTNSTFAIWNTIKRSQYSEANYSYFTLQITPRNIVNGSDYGQLNIDGQPVTSGQPATIVYGSHSFSTYTGLIQNNNKFRTWSGYTQDNFNNPVTININHSGEMEANFYPTYSLTVNYNLEGASGSGNFQIYWQQGNVTYTQANGINNPFYAFDYTKNSDAYNITALSVPDQYNTSWQFINWDDGNTYAQRSNEIFSSSKSYTAYYKGHLVSSIQTATSYGSQRKIAKDYNGTLHMVYASANKIWYTYSTNGGSTWSADQQISGSGSASTPSIAASGGNIINDVYFVWQEVAGSTNYLYIKSLNSIPTSTALDSDASSVDLQPSVAVSTDEDKVLVMYKKMYSGRYQIHYKYSTDGGSNFSVGGPLSIGTPIIWNLPSVAWNQQSNKFMVSTIYSSGYLTTDLLSFNGSTWTNEGNVYYSNQVPNAAPYSQVAVDGTGRTHVTWIAYDNYYGENSAAMERSMLNGNWSAVTMFRDEIIYDPSIVYTSVCGHNDADGGASIFYTSGSNQTLFDIYSTDNSSWNGTIYISPSAPISYPGKRDSTGIS